MTRPEQHQTVFRPLLGIQLKRGTPSFELGGVRIATFSTRDRARIMRTLRSIARSSPYPKEQMDEFLRDEMKTMNALVGQTVAWSVHVADAATAEELSGDTLKKSLLFLKYALVALHTGAVEYCIGTQVEKTAYYIVPEDQDSFVIGAKLVGRYRPWAIDRTELKRMKATGVFQLSDAFGESVQGTKLPRRSFVRALLNSAEWIAAAQDQVKLSIRLLCLMIALETLFSSNERDRIRSLVSERAAAVVCSAPDDRKTMATKLRRLYDRRSDISHGRTTGVTELDASLLEFYATQVVSRLCPRMHDYVTLKDFLAALDTERTRKPS